MSDMTIDRLQAQNGPLKAQNVERLEELKKTKASGAKSGLREEIDNC